MRPISRRHALQSLASGFGYLAFASLASGAAGNDAAGKGAAGKVAAGSERSVYASGRSA
jgi:hypothetical protein